MKNIHILNSPFIVLFIIIGIAILSSFTLCKSNKTVKTTTPRIISTSQTYEFYKDGRFTTFTTVSKFEFEGHSYIIFDEGYGKTVLHDPNCKCHK